MTDIQAALGISQIKRIDSFINNRHKIKKKYDQKLLELPVVLPFQDSNAHSAMHLYAIQIKHNIVKKSHKQLFDEMRARNIGVNLHYIPIHIHPYYIQMGFKQGDFPNAESYYSRAMSLPIFNTMTDFQQNKVITALSEVLS